MPRCAITQDLVEGETVAQATVRMEELASRIRQFYPKVEIERVGPVLITAQIPEGLVETVRSLGCKVDCSPPRQIVSD